MKISNTPDVSVLLQAIANLRKARPHSDILISAIRFNLENEKSLSTSSSLVDRSIALIPPTMNPENLKTLPSQIKVAAPSKFKHIIAPIFRLLKKARSSKSEEPPRLTVKTIMLTGAALVLAWLVIKFVIPYFFSRPAPKKPEALPTSKQDIPAPASHPALQPIAPSPDASSIPPPSDGSAREAERKSSQAEDAARTSAPASLPDEAAPLSSPIRAILAAPAPMPLPVAPPPVEETELIAKPSAGESPPLTHVAQPASPPSSPPSSPSDEGTPESRTWLQSAAGALRRATSDARHFSKWKKYRIIQGLMRQFSLVPNLPLKISSQDPTEKISTSWNTLVETLINPDKEKNADNQYRAIVLALRQSASLLVSAEENIKRQFASQFKFIKQLSYFRFAGIGLFNYCRELVELGTGKELPTDLNLESFLKELKSRAKKLDRPDDALAVNSVAGAANKLSGAVNIGFDPLLKSNVPYRDGLLKINGQEIYILRHAGPYDNNDPFGLALRILNKAARQVPLVNKFVSTDPVSAEPLLNADYEAFLQEAEERGENILQVILENGEEQVMDESARVRARLKLSVIHKNLFALALRFDGSFFKRQYLRPNNASASGLQGMYTMMQNLLSFQSSAVSLPVNEPIESVESLKERLKQQLLTPIDITKSDENTLSDVQALEKMFEQLKNTGFCIPETLIKRTELRENIDRLLSEVQELYFPNHKNIESLLQHQAFIVLSYVHIVLFICVRLNISILEAFCKDDIDRGNAFKTILKLHFLYLTGQLNSETLLYVLVNTLAAPFIVKKQAIIESRLVLIEYVLPFLQAAFARTPNPKTTIFGETINNPSYSVFKVPAQTIYPDNLSSENIEEYLAFLEAKPIILPNFQGNLIKETAQAFKKDEISKDIIVRSAKALNLKVDSELLKPRLPSTEKQVEHYYTHIPLERIMGILKYRGDLSDAEVWEISSCMQLGLHTKLHEQLKATFDNPALNLTVELDLEAMSKTPETGISLDVGDDKIARLKFDLIYKIVEDKPGVFPSPVIACMKASITIPDHRTGQAQFDWSLIKG